MEEEEKEECCVGQDGVTVIGMDSEGGVDRLHLFASLLRSL